MITRSFLTKLDKYSKPAMLRESLEKVVLNVKQLRQQGSPKSLLALAIQPPKEHDIERSVLLLKEVGALSLRPKNTFDQRSHGEDGDLTYVGNVMNSLPIDVRLSKLILLGHSYGKLRETTIIAAGLSKKSIFTTLFKSYMEAFNHKWIYSEGWMCDCISILRAVNLYESKINKGTFGDFDIKRSPSQAEKKWARLNAIEIGRLREGNLLLTQLFKLS